MTKILARWAGICCICLSSWHVQAQYTLHAVPPAPQFTFNDLWHFTVVRSQADNFNAFYVSLRIFGGESQLRVKSNTAVVNFATGSHYYNASNSAALQPFATSYYDGGMLQQVVSSGGLFPAGTYNMVYTLYGRSADGEFAPLAEDQVSLTVEAMWPPMLLSPPDGDTINTTYPLLTWTPAFNSAFSGTVTYSLKLVEQLAGQNAYQAIQANPAYFTQAGLNTTTLPYPAGAQSLDTGKVYAWQVHADADGAGLGASEIWTFTLATPEHPTETVRANPVYFDIKHSAPFEVYYITDGFLYIKYEEEYATENGQELRFEVLDKNFKPKSPVSLSVPINKGLNRIKINQCQLNLGNPKAGDYFYFKVKNKKSETFTLKFYPNVGYSCP